MVEVSVSARWAHAAMRKMLRQEVTKISGEALWDIVDQAAEYAYDGYSKAKYAGVDVEGLATVDPVENGPLSYKLVVEAWDGESDVAPYIEYGTGVYGTHSVASVGVSAMIKKRAPKFKDKWWFNEGDRDIVHNDFAEPALPRMQKYDVAPESYTMTARGKKIVASYKRVKLKEPIPHEKPGVWFTRGNPANNVLGKTREELLEHIVPDVVIKYGGRTL